MHRVGLQLSRAPVQESTCARGDVQNQRVSQDVCVCVCVWGRVVQKGLPRWTMPTLAVLRAPNKLEAETCGKIFAAGPTSLSSTHKNQVADAVRCSLMPDITATDRRRLLREAANAKRPSCCAGQTRRVSSCAHTFPSVSPSIGLSHGPRRGAGARFGRKGIRPEEAPARTRSVTAPKSPPPLTGTGEG